MAAAPSASAAEPEGVPSIARMRAGLSGAEVVRLLDYLAAKEEPGEMLEYVAHYERGDDDEPDDDAPDGLDWNFGDAGIGLHCGDVYGPQKSVCVVVSARSCGRAWAALARQSDKCCRMVRTACTRAAAEGLRVGVDCDFGRACREYIDITESYAEYEDFVGFFTLMAVAARISASPMVKAVSRARA